MIFNEGYDKTLWLMLAGDKENRNKLVYFIRTMPEQIYNDILKMINYGAISNKHYIYPVVNEMLMEDGFEYFYRYGIVSDRLELYVSRCNLDLNLVETFTLDLNVFDFEELMSVDFMDAIKIGSFSWTVDRLDYDMDSVVSSRNGLSREYRLYKEMFNNIIVGNGDLRTRVNYLSKCPDDMHLDDFSTDKKVNGLVKKRKRRKQGSTRGEKNGF